MEKQNNVIHPSSPEEAVKFFKSELDRYAALSDKPTSRSTRSSSDPGRITSPPDRPIRNRQDRSLMSDLFDNPMGLMASSSSSSQRRRGCSSRAFEKLGFTEWRDTAPRTSRSTVRGHQLHRQPGPEKPRLVLRKRARPLGLRPGLPGQGRAQGLSTARWSSGRSRSKSHRPDGAAPARHQGHRRRAALPDRPVSKTASPSTTSISSSWKASTPTRQATA